MTNYKILKNFEPFSDILFKTCFYNAFFPVILHFEKSIIPFLINDIFTYKFDNNACTLSHNIITINSENTILETMGIEKREYRVTSNLIQQINNSILANKPVILFIDCYYESIRHDAYLKNHFWHFLLIYGFNNYEKVLNIIEHKFRDSNSYEKSIISYSDVINSYNGAMENFTEYSELPFIFEYSLEDKELANSTIVKNCIFFYSDKVLSEIEYIYNSIDNLKLYCELFNQVIYDRDLLAKNIDIILNDLNSIYNIKCIEKYRFLKVFGNNVEIENLISLILNNLNYTRGLIAKFKFSYKYDIESLKMCALKLSQIYDTEQKYHSTLFYFLKSFATKR